MATGSERIDLSAYDIHVIETDCGLVATVEDLPDCPPAAGRTATDLVAALVKAIALHSSDHPNVAPHFVRDRLTRSTGREGCAQPAVRDDPPPTPSASEYVVLRAEGTLQDSDLPRSLESTWRKRADMGPQDYVEILGAAGNMRAYPTDRSETAPDGSVAQVYEVAVDAADREALRTDNLALLANHQPPGEQE